MKHFIAPWVELCRVTERERLKGCINVAQRHGREPQEWGGSLLSGTHSEKWNVSKFEEVQVSFEISFLAALQFMLCDVNNNRKKS